MAAQYPNITLGTAGHIDHGKTALVKFLTGCDTDRLKEEKARGMTIELGFAPCTILDMEVGIVDVPGHENFVKTMVAGASGIDGVIFVVAADDGVMPQTREHLDILTLLGIRHGLIALTKIDRVSPEDREAAREQVTDLLKGTFLDGAPICPISNVTGEGFDGFYTALAGLVHSITPKRTDGVFRVPVERAFSLKGIGTIVAGIPVAGSARLGEELTLLPQDINGQLRGIQVYGRNSETVLAGQCAALNVRNWTPDVVERGSVIAAPGYFSAQEWFVLRLRLLSQEKLFLKSGARVKFHTGTSEVLAAVYPLQGQVVQAGEECLVQVRAEVPLVAGPGDRFIIRSFSPPKTIGGGMIVESTPRRLKRDQLEVLADLAERADAVSDERRFVEYCVKKCERLAANEAEIAQRAKIPRNRLPAILDALIHERKIIQLSPALYMHRETLTQATERIIAVVRDFHERRPESPGIEPDGLLATTGVSKEVLSPLEDFLLKQGKLVKTNQRLALPSHKPTFAKDDSALMDRIESLFRDAPFAPPGAEEVAEKVGLPAGEVDKILRILLENNRLVKVAEGMFFHREAVERAKEAVVAHIRKEGRLESVKFKYLVDTTRKFALPLLDYLDRIGVTSRIGNTRYLKPS